MRLVFVTAAALVAATAAHAQDASTEMLQAALQAAAAQRDQALNDGVRLSANLSMAQREIARLRKDLDEARKPAGAAEPAK